MLSSWTRQPLSSFPLVHQGRLGLLSEYLSAVLDGRLPVNHDIINIVQVGWARGADTACYVMLCL